MRQSLPTLRPTRDYISYSAISTYQMCSLRYYFRYVLELPEETVTASMAVGRGVHAALQYHFEQLLQGNPPPSRDILLDVFWDAWREHEAEIRFAVGENINTVGWLADRILLAFRASPLAEPGGEILAVEEELRGELIPGLPELRARVDLIVETKDALVVTDFKTSRCRWGEANIAEAAPQLLLYSELARKMSIGKPLRLEFAVLTKTKIPDLARHAVALDRGQVNRTKRIVERVWSGVESGIFFPAPSLMNCSSCPFRAPCRNWTG